MRFEVDSAHPKPFGPQAFHEMAADETAGAANKNTFHISVYLENGSDARPDIFG